jgi:hypothetical protein
VPLPDPIEKPLIEELESLIPGVAPTKHSILPEIKTNKTLLYQTPGESENSEQLNLIETASEPASEFSRTEADTFIINKASDINSIPSANTSPLITNSTFRDSSTLKFDPLIGKLDSDLEDLLINPNQIVSNTHNSDFNKADINTQAIHTSINYSELNKTTADTTAASDKLPEKTTQLPAAAVAQSERENSQVLLVVTAETTSEEARSETTLITTAETTSKPEEHQTPLSSETTLKSESEPNTTSPATASTTDKSESNKTSLTENSTANNLEVTTTIESDKASTSSTSSNFDSNAFSVDEKGIIGIQFTSDRGLYTGQLALVSLKGMEKFVLGSEAFIKEAASRALSNSTNGYITISDDLEGAYYTNPNSSENFNSGQYLGTKTFAMTPGDKFFFMLVPNGTVQQVYDNPAIGGDKKPLFSIATDNPSDGFSIGQIADITGESQLFVMEDMALSQGSNLDYDDITFRVTGATSKIVPLSQLVGSFSASLPSQLIQKLKGELDKSEPKFTRESIITNSGEKSQGETPSITTDYDQQKSQPTAATIANSDSQESPPTETSIVVKSETQESPATETSIVDKSETQESPATEISIVVKSETQEWQQREHIASPPETPSVSSNELNSEIEQPVSAESLVSESAGAELIKTDTTATNLIPQLPAEADDAVNNAASPPTAETLLTSTPIALQPAAKTDALADNFGKKLPTQTDDNLSNAASQSPTKLAEVILAENAAGAQENDWNVTENAAELETEQFPTTTVEIATENAVDLIEDDTAFPEIAAELETEQLVTITESIAATAEADDTVEREFPVAEITAEFESKRLPPKTEALAVAEFTAARIDTDTAVLFTAAELETENPPAIVVNSLELDLDSLISHSNSSLQTDSAIPRIFSNSSGTAAGTAQIASVETSASPSTLKSPPEPISNTNNSSV